MSHRIEYFHLVVRFPEAALAAALPDEHIFSDHYLCLALGGDNNMTTIHPVTRREVCSRRWSVIAAGSATECIREIARYSGYCEGGGMRLTGHRHTKPETYIRSWRNAIESAIPYDRLLYDTGVSVMSTLSVGGVRREDRAAQVKRLSAHMQPVGNADGGISWSLNLMDIRDAAIFFQYHRIDSSDCWMKANASGPLFGDSFERIVRSVARCKKAAA